MEMLPDDWRVQSGVQLSMFEKLNPDAFVAFWLRRIVPYVDDPAASVQTPQDYRDYQTSQFSRTECDGSAHNCLTDPPTHTAAFLFAGLSAPTAAPTQPAATSQPPTP